MSKKINAINVEQAIFFVRGQKVILDRDLGQLFDVPTKVLNQAVKRHQERFPEDFMFVLTEKEKMELVTNWGCINQFC